MYDLSEHPFFEKWKDPESGVVSYILKERIAPIQQTFYFTNYSVTPNGEYLWFYAAFPPTRMKFLAYVGLNPEKPVIKFFPQAGFNDASPMVAPDSSGAYYMSGRHLCFIDLEGKVKIIGSIPDEYINFRYLFRSSTHLSLSADGEWFLLDGEVGNHTFIALINAHSGEFKLLHEFSYFHNHSIFSPVDPKLFLCPRDHHRDPVTGKRFEIEFRLWLMDIDQTFYRHLCPELWERHGVDSAHEWWSKDGMVCFVDYDRGVYEVDAHTLEKTHVWKRPVCHAHCNSDRTLYCADQSPYKWGPQQPLEMLFYNRVTGKETKFVSAMPSPTNPEIYYQAYHHHPHPQFSPDDSMIIYSTTKNGMLDVAVTPVEQLL